MSKSGVVTVSVIIVAMFFFSEIFFELPDEGLLHDPHAPYFHVVSLFHRGSFSFFFSNTESFTRNSDINPLG